MRMSNTSPSTGARISHSFETIANRGEAFTDLVFLCLHVPDFRFGLFNALGVDLQNLEFTLGNPAACGRDTRPDITGLTFEVGSLAFARHQVRKPRDLLLVTVPGSPQAPAQEIRFAG